MKTSFTRALIALTAGVFIWSCATGPSLGSQSQSLDSYWTSTGKSYQAGAQFNGPMAWAAGQYVVVGSTTNKARTAVSRTLLVRQEQGGWVVETSTTSAKAPQKVTQMLITGFDQAMSTGDVSGLDLVWIKTLNKNGSVTTMQGAQLGMMKGLYKSAYESMVVKKTGFTDGGTIEVPAGSFAGTSLVKATTKVMLFTVDTESWLHSAVPISGMVKSSTTDGKTVSELLSFGFDGVAQIPPG